MSTAVGKWVLDGQAWPVAGLKQSGQMFAGKKKAAVGKCTKTDKKAKVCGRERVVYKGCRGGEFVLVKGKRVYL
jgi:PBCV-specific basic adaptor domain